MKSLVIMGFVLALCLCITPVAEARGLCRGGSCSKSVTVEKTQTRQPAGAVDKDGKKIGGQFKKTVKIEKTAPTRLNARRHLFGRVW
jgi:hypothetical protein